MIKYCELEVVRYCINELLKRVGLVMLVVVTLLIVYLLVILYGIY